jgi:hypothetical protein
VVDKINEFRAVLKDPSKSREDRRFALRFLVHCVEDMHMPCHVGDNHDNGGNKTQVRFFDKGTNMHSLWDSGMIARVSGNPRTTQTGDTNAVQSCPEGGRGRYVAKVERRISTLGGSEALGRVATVQEFGFGTLGSISTDSPGQRDSVTLALLAHLSSMNRMNHGHAKAHIAVAEARLASVAVRRASIARVVVPPAASVRPVRGMHRALRVIHWR